MCTKSTTTPHVKHVLNYSNIEKSNDDSNKMLEGNNLIIADIKHVSIKSEPIKEEEKVVNNQIISKDINLVDNSLLIEKDKKIKDLICENNYLRKKMNELYTENKFLEEKNQREMFIINNKHKYDEILENVKYLNTRITQQFFETNYSEYVLI